MWRFSLGKVSPQWKKRTLDSGRDGPEERLRTCVRRSSTADEAAGIISRELDPSSNGAKLGKLAPKSTDERTGVKPASGSDSPWKDTIESLAALMSGGGLRFSHDTETSSSQPP